jgi:tRNA-dependent cyclodipeptide synthase
MKKYRAKLNFSIEKGKKCIFCISVGQKYHEGEKLEACIDLINKSFSYCDIIMADTLQRHTISLKEDNFEQKSLIMGDEWLIRNDNILKNLSIPYKITRWNEFRFHEKYEYYSILINEMYENNNRFKISVDNTINKFQTNYLKYNQCVEIEKINSICLRYILEECAILNLFTNFNSEYMIYPAKLPSSFDVILENIIIKTAVINFYSL